MIEPSLPHTCSPKHTHRLSFPPTHVRTRACNCLKNMLTFSFLKSNVCLSSDQFEKWSKSIKNNIKMILTVPLVLTVNLFRGK